MRNGMNWNSRTKEWSHVVRPETKEKAKLARGLKEKGLKNTEIASILGLSAARISELLRTSPTEKP